MHVVVVGAGIVGASIAYHLSLQGAKVTVIDKEGPASHASRGTFAWINATWAKQPREYHKLSQDSVAAWRNLACELKLPVRWGGSLEWFEGEERQKKLAEQIAEQADWGEPARMVPRAEIDAMEPNVDFGAASAVALSGNDGAVDPIGATNMMLEAAKELGATIVYPCNLQGIDFSGDKIRGLDTTRGRMFADRVVLATGAAPDSGSKFASSDIPQRSRPGIIAITKPMPLLLNHIVAGPGAHLHQRKDGRVVIGEQSGAPDNEAHAARLQGRPNDFPSNTIAAEHFARMIGLASEFVSGLESAEPENMYIGWRPLPLDGHPVIGFSPARPSVYMAVMHSGVTLSPIAGQLAAREIVDDQPVAQLDPFRPGRDFEMIKRY